MNFGTSIKEKRIAARHTLRGFTKLLGIDPSNWSKVERGVIHPPQDALLFDQIASVLELDVQEIQELKDLADVARGQIPADLQDSELIAKMPAFFRAIKGQEYTLEDLEKLKQGIRDLNS